MKIFAINYFMLNLNVNYNLKTEWYFKIIGILTDNVTEINTESCSS